MFSLVLTVAENAHSPSHLNCASCCTDMCSEEIMTPRRLQKKENYDGYQLQRDGLHNRLKSLDRDRG